MNEKIILILIIIFSVILSFAWTYFRYPEWQQYLHVFSATLVGVIIAVIYAIRKNQCSKLSE